MSKVGVIIQARMGSSRLPGKLSHQILGKEMLYHQISRLKKNGIANVIVATSTHPSDDLTSAIATAAGADIFRGSESDVLQRFCKAAEAFDLNYVIRTGGDDPLIDPEGIKAVIAYHEQNPHDFIYNSHRQGWVYGTACEMFSIETLSSANKLATSSIDREHIITFIKHNPLFTQARVSPTDPALIRPYIYLSVDYPEDIQLVEQVLVYFNQQGKLYSFTQAELIALYDSGQLDIKNRLLHEGFAD